MPGPGWLLLAFVAGLVLGHPHQHHGRERALAEHWGDLWLVGLTPGAGDPRAVARELGYWNLGEMSAFPGHFLFQRPGHAGGTEARGLTERLLYDGRVQWAEQQFDKVRVKREPGRPEEYGKAIPEELVKLWAEEAALDSPGRPLPRDETFNDELWDHQWYLHDTRTAVAGLPDISLHVEEAWAQGYTGKGVRVVVLDDGLDWEHPDLAANYDPGISYDFNGNDSDPMPADSVNSHGTRCAGEVAMLANNGLCGVGVAMNCSIGGIRMLDGRISDTLEGRALSFALHAVDVFSSSWGPSDDGATVEGPGRLAALALKTGVTQGRGGRGVVYVWASGNGGSKGDDCNCDGYSSSPYTMSVSSASQQGAATWYGESCPSTLTSTYSSGAYTDQKIATTDVGGGCTVSHTGTSAAAPLAAGVVALVLEAAPLLTWRDVQHVVVRASDPAPVASNPGWRTNGAGRLYNPRFGFGILDAGQAVTTALAWRPVPPRQTCTVRGEKDVRLGDTLARMAVRESDVVGVTFLVGPGCGVTYTEHVEVVVSVAHPRRGALEVVVVSPLGTSTRLLAPRPGDDSKGGFSAWPLMSVESWGERPAGLWRLYIVDRGDGAGVWSVGDCSLLLHGHGGDGTEDGN